MTSVRTVAARIVVAITPCDANTRVLCLAIVIGCSAAVRVAGAAGWSAESSLRSASQTRQESTAAPERSGVRPEEDVRRLRLAAEQGDAKAQFALGS